jgi:hypothetical protein
LVNISVSISTSSFTSAKKVLSKDCCSDGVANSSK